MERQFTLGKNERLKSRKLIEQLFNEGKYISISPFRVYYLITTLKIENAKNHQTPIQFAVGVSAKNFKKAVDRNRIKRLTREAYRLLKQDLVDKVKKNNQQLNLFFIYSAKELPDFKTIREKLKLILNKLMQTIS